MKFKEFFLGTPEERQADQTKKELSSVDSLNARKRAKLERATQLSRRRFLRLGAVGAATATLGALGVHEMLKDKDEVMLGNVTFYLDDESALGKSERIVLFANMKRAYQKLEAYFAEGPLVLPRPIKLPIKIKSDVSSLPLGRVESDSTMRYDNEGLPKLEFFPEFKSLTLKSSNESTLAHELFHLFVQWNDVGTQAFVEGHAHALEKELYGTVYNPEDIVTLLEIPEIKAVVDVGLDSYQFDRAYKGGVSSVMLERLLRSRWEVLWLGYVEKNPSFFKRFYAEIGRQRRAGTIGFSKSELIGIADRISPGFKEWFWQEPAFHDLDSHGPRESCQAVFIEKNAQLFVSNLLTHGRHREGDKITPPYLSQKYEGAFKIVWFDPGSGNRNELNPPITDPNVVFIALPNSLLKQPFEVWFGDHRVPLVKR